MNIILKGFLGILCVMVIVSSFTTLGEMGTDAGTIFGFIIMVGLGIFGLYKLFLAPPKTKK